MHELLRRLKVPPLELLKFVWRVVWRFFGQNNGFLLAGAVAYNALLSLIPLFALLLIALSHVFDQAVIMRAVSTELSLVVPGQGDRIIEAIMAFIAERDLVGGIGFLVVIFFSSIAFRILEEAFSVIFEHHHDKAKRHFLVSAIIPYIYIGFVGLSLVALTVITGALETLDGTTLTLLGFSWTVTSIGPWLMRLLGLVGLILMFSSIYMVMPTARIPARRAIIGGIIAAILWEGVRSLLVWYFDNLSLVNVVYGSLAAIIIILLSLEFAAIIILLGAQTIAEFERAERAEVPWWADPETWTEGGVEVELDEELAGEAPEEGASSSEAGASERAGGQGLSSSSSPSST